MWLYTAQGNTAQKGRHSTADEFGLTDHLGYRPLFCSYLNPDSLADSWFRIWSASPRYVDEIQVFEVDDNDAISMDVLKWTNEAMRYNKNSCDLSTILNVPHSETTDYLVHPDVDRKDEIVFNLNDLVNDTFADLDMPKEIEIFWKSISYNAQIILHSLHHEMTNGETMPKDPMRITKEYWYNIVKMTMFVPAAWSYAFNDCKLNPKLITADSLHLFAQRDFQEAQDLLTTWDNRLSQQEEFTREEFLEMRHLFISACDGFTAAVNEDFASCMHIGRNDPCFCGNGKKFKKCHLRLGMDNGLLF